MSFDFGTGRAKREPSADVRRMADALHEFYTAQVTAGFTKHQALQLTLQFLDNVMTSGMEQGGDD